jgi:hypothetical protein
LTFAVNADTDPMFAEVQCCPIGTSFTKVRLHGGNATLKLPIDTVPKAAETGAAHVPVCDKSYCCLP